MKIGKMRYSFIFKISSYKSNWIDLKRFETLLPCKAPVFRNDPYGDMYIGITINLLLHH